MSNTGKYKNGLEGYMLGVSTVCLRIGCVYGCHITLLLESSFPSLYHPAIQLSGNPVGLAALTTPRTWHSHPLHYWYLAHTTITSLLNHCSSPLPGLSAPTLAAQTTHNTAARITLPNISQTDNNSLLLNTSQKLPHFSQSESENSYTGLQDLNGIWLCLLLLHVLYPTTLDSWLLEHYLHIQHIPVSRPLHWPFLCL